MRVDVQNVPFGNPYTMQYSIKGLVTQEAIILAKYKQY